MAFFGVCEHFGRTINEDLHYGRYRLSGWNLDDKLVRFPQVSWDKVFYSM